MDTASTHKPLGTKGAAIKSWPGEDREPREIHETTAMASTMPVPASARAEITPDLIKRVSERIASGIPIRLALVGEGVTVPEYKEHLFKHPELQAIQDVERRKFLENAINMLLECENRGVHIRWLLERFYPHALQPESGEGAEDDLEKPKTVAGVLEKFIELFREHARRL